MKRILILVLLLISLASFGQEVNPPLVSVTGKGVVKVVPDQVVIRARVEHTGKSPAEVKKQNDKVVNEIITYLKSEGIDPKDFQTEYISLNKDYNYNTKETFYSANQSISIQLKDLKKYEEIMSGLLQSGLNRIDGIQFKSSKREELESEARAKAILDAREKARQYAQALGQEIGKARLITELDGGGNFPPMYRVMEMKAADNVQEETLAPGEMEIVVKVNAAFLLD